MCTTTTTFPFYLTAFSRITPVWAGFLDNRTLVDNITGAGFRQAERPSFHPIKKTQSEWQTSLPVPPHGDLDKRPLLDVRLVPPPGELDEKYAVSLIRHIPSIIRKHGAIDKTVST